MYADDLIVYCRANIEEAQVVKDCLDIFCNICGQETNYRKSMIHFSANVS